MDFDRRVVRDPPPSRFDFKRIKTGTGHTAINPERTRTTTSAIGVQVRIGRTNASTAEGIGDFGKRTLRALLRFRLMADHPGRTI